MDTRSDADRLAGLKADLAKLEDDNPHRPVGAAAREIRELRREIASIERLRR